MPFRIQPKSNTCTINSSTNNDLTKYFSIRDMSVLWSHKLRPVALFMDEGAEKLSFSYYVVGPKKSI